MFNVLWGSGIWADYLQRWYFLGVVGIGLVVGPTVGYVVGFAGYSAS